MLGILAKLLVSAAKELGIEKNCFYNLISAKEQKILLIISLYTYRYYTDNIQITFVYFKNLCYLSLVCGASLQRAIFATNVAYCEKLFFCSLFQGGRLFDLIGYLFDPLFSLPPSGIGYPK